MWDQGCLCASKEQKGLRVNRSLYAEQNKLQSHKVRDWELAAQTDPQVYTEKAIQ